MEIDKKIAEWLGFTRTVCGREKMFETSVKTFFYAREPELWKKFRAWLLSPLGTVAMMEAFGRDGVIIAPRRRGNRWKCYRLYMDGAIWYEEMTVDCFPDLPTAAYMACRKYMEGK